MTFIDRICASYDKSGSLLVAGIDPRQEGIPDWCWEDLPPASPASMAKALTRLIEIAIPALSGSILALKPNIAFFEQLGSSGIAVVEQILQLAAHAEIPVILDGKRGDIGSTAEAYANAYLGDSASPLKADALTVNPFLGFDTLVPFVKRCSNHHGGGIFVLVKTSNPGSGDIQDAGDGQTISERIATWIQVTGASLCGTCGLSSIGAVVGATYPAELEKFRTMMPNTPFLIPGYGVQGGSAKDIIGGLCHNGRKFPGVLINASRGLFQAEPVTSASPTTYGAAIKAQADALSSDLQNGLGL